MTTENGSAPMTIAVWMAVVPPEISSPATTIARATPQNTTWGRDLGPSSPAALIVFTIRTAESAEVTRKVSSRTTISTAMPHASQSAMGASMNSVMAKIMSPFAASKITPLAPPFSSRSMAVPPAQANQTKHISAGTISAPRTNSRTVRPREMRARNRPTKGAKAIHHAQ